jgi:DNA polymerase III epsilon subunit-like protein
MLLQIRLNSTNWYVGAGCGNNRSLCTLKISRKLYPNLPNYKLKTVSRYLLRESCNQVQMHRALDDAKLAAMIWLEMEKV